ncbi:spore germination protein KA [Paenibacillus mucilaginosus]|uniref:spore germination protein n=1 Tax=Paenibacillus mucilaginosus TaxID=61624 RepID=UPI003D1AC2DD
MFPWNLKGSRRRTQPHTGGKPGSDSPKEGKQPLSLRLDENLSRIREELGNSPDITIRSFKVDGFDVQAAAVYTDGITDKTMVSNFILHSIMSSSLHKRADSGHSSLSRHIRDNALAVGEVSTARDWQELILAVLSGDTVLLVDGSAEAMVCGTRGGEMRSVTEPSSQVVIRGPKDGFTESIATNVALVRRRIRSPHLLLESMKLGAVTQTDVAIMYIRGLANDKIVEEVRRRLHAIETDAILESGYIEQFIEDDTSTLFPTLYNTERPDSIAGNLLEGRIAVFVDGTPFVLIAPTTFFMFFQSAEDYYQRFEIATAIRILRHAAFLISLFVPSIYIAAITFHHEMVPTLLLISLAAQREGVPFPAFIEAMIMEVTFEILREAGIRMPRAIGQAVSIVGALVLGQAAVEAGIISSAMVIVVALTGISSFSTPAYNLSLSIRLIRFLMMACAGLLGFYGIMILSIILLAHMCALRSFGIPYMTPFGPFIMQDQKDSLLRIPLGSLFSRPRLVNQKNTIRMEPTGSSDDAMNGGDSS